MLTPLHEYAQIPGFLRACSFEHVFGSRIITAFRAGGLGADSFFLCEQEGVVTAALYLSEGVLTLSARPDVDLGAVAELARQLGVQEIDGTLEHCSALQRQLGGTLESSWFMAYRGGPVEDDFPDIGFGDPETTFSLLQQSHEYYRTHLDFLPWLSALRQRLDRGLAELYHISLEGEVVGTGSVGTQDGECGVVTAVAVLPAFRHRGLGSRMTRFLTGRILEMGKTPRLMAGYDKVADMYRRLGYVPEGRWGELYLS